MKESRFHYFYSTEFCERYDLTGVEAAKVLKDEMNFARKNNRAVILTGKFSEEKHFFSAYSADKLTHNFVWIHISSQELLGFDDDTPQEGKFYISTFTGNEKELNIS
ncbi:MAG: hypothetical protein J6R66_02990 [Clostridia bacterium]|nr:hypothetical protein [Clostridia bacterium]